MDGVLAAMDLLRLAMLLGPMLVVITKDYTGLGGQLIVYRQGMDPSFKSVKAVQTPCGLKLCVSSTAG